LRVVSAGNATLTAVFRIFAAKKHAGDWIPQHLVTPIARRFLISEENLVIVAVPPRNCYTLSRRRIGVLERIKTTAVVFGVPVAFEVGRVPPLESYIATGIGVREQIAVSGKK
jgi:hypothetical protein